MSPMDPMSAGPHAGSPGRSVRTAGLAALAALLLTAVFLSCRYIYIYIYMGAPAVTARFQTDGGTAQDLTLFFQDDALYAFFPSYADLTGVVFESGSGGVQILSGEEGTDAPADLTGAVGGAPLTLILRTGEQERRWPLYVCQSGEIAALWIRTESGSVERIHASKEVKERAEILLIGSDGVVDAEGGGTIKCHGNTSFTLAEKKSYRIKFDERTPLLGMDPAKKWILRANVFDSSKIRERVCLYLAETLGLPFAVETGYVDLYLDGAYAGNYMVMDQVTVARNRVDIPEEGSFLINTGYRADPDETVFRDDADWYFTIKHPEDAGEETVAAIRDLVNEIEREIAELGEDDPLDRLGARIDLDSFAIMYLVDQISNELDSNIWSTYYYLDARDRLFHAGPAWDFDRSLGNHWRIGVCPEVDAFNDGLPEQLWKNRSFRDLVRETLERRPGLLEDLLACADASAQTIGRSDAMDRIRWGRRFDDLGQFMDRSTDPGETRQHVDTGDLAYDVAYVKDALEDRFDLIEDTIVRPDEWCRVRIRGDLWGRTVWRTVWVRRGGTISASALDLLRGRYSCDGFAFGSGALIWDGFPILDDLILTPYHEPETASVPEKEGAKGMDFLIFIVIAVPGLIALLLSGRYPLDTRRGVLQTIGAYGIYDLAILLSTYAVLFVLKGNSTIGWGTAVTGYDHPVSKINVLLGIMVLQTAGGVVVGLCARLWSHMTRSPSLRESREEDDPRP